MPAFAAADGGGRWQRARADAECDHLGRIDDIMLVSSCPKDILDRYSELGGVCSTTGLLIKPETLQVWDSLQEIQSALVANASMSRHRWFSSVAGIVPARSGTE